MLEQQIFTFYQEKFRPIYGDLVAIKGSKPLEIMGELEAFMSHMAIAKTSTDPQVVESNLGKAQGHLHRACLDAAKMLWLELRKQADRQYNNQFVRMWCAKISENELEYIYQQANRIAIEARRQEISSVGISPEASIDSYYKAANEYQNFLNAIDWNRVQKIPMLQWGFILKQQFSAFMVGILTAGIVAWLTVWITTE